jgi:hypothetical protein
MGFVADVRAASHRDPARLIYPAHASPGRLRFRLTWLRDAPAEARPLADALSSLSGVAQVRVRAFTGSVLVLYDPDHVDAERITRALLDATHLDHVTISGQETAEDLDRILHEADDNGSAVSRAMVECLEGLHIDFLRLTGGRLSLGSFAAIGLLGSSAARLFGEDVELPPWYQLAWWGFKSLQDVHKRAIARRIGLPIVPPPAGE